MPVTFFRKARRLAVLAIIPLLASCSSTFDTGSIFSIFGSPRPPLPCPSAEILPGADTITIFREGPGRDLVDVTYEGVLTAVSGECQYVDDDAAVDVSLILRIDATMGPAAQARKQDFPFFVAISDKKGKILAKKVFSSPIEIPEERRRGAVQEEIEQHIPLSAIQTGADFVVIAGFQLTKEQLDLSVKASNK
ncbi:MAG: hypothetical protein EP348_04750 [Alphaproteobacteria bacterium]|nr:MAG: hypothetical protein EP348_04750 [Alphaproteobacteria bacterium]